MLIMCWSISSIVVSHFYLVWSGAKVGKSCRSALRAAEANVAGPQLFWLRLKRIPRREARRGPAAIENHGQRDSPNVAKLVFTCRNRLQCSRERALQSLFFAYLLIPRFWGTKIIYQGPDSQFRSHLLFFGMFMLACRTCCEMRWCQLQHQKAPPAC